METVQGRIALWFRVCVTPSKLGEHPARHHHPRCGLGELSESLLLSLLIHTMGARAASIHRPSQRLGEAWQLDLKPVFDVGDLVTMPGDPWGPERQPSPRRDGVMAFTAVGAHALLLPDLRSGCQGALWRGEGSGPRF